jgi:glycosyltransferase involved in cell wall biosynthesis
MPVVSVLLPCYNAAETIDSTLESLTQQTLRDFELIAVDDGSTDGTIGILQRWADGDARIRLIQQDHSGIVKALNAGLEKCRAEYIARIDADDLAHPERLAKQVSFLVEHHDIALVSCQVKGFPPENVRQGFEIYLEWQNSLLTNEDIQREIFIESPIAHPSVVVRKDWLLKVGAYQERGWPEDYDLWLRLYLAGARFAKLPEILLEWREHEARLTRQDSRYSLENFLRLKAHYLVQGPLLGRESVLIWGAGMMGRRLSKHLLRAGAPLSAFVDVDPDKIGRTRWDLPILSHEQLPDWWRDSPNPIVLASVGSRGARQLIRAQLTQYGLQEAIDWWCLA